MKVTAPSFRLDGKRALVTGAGRGIGQAISEALAAAGAEVTLCARSVDEIEATAEGIRRAGYQAEAMPADMTDVRGFADIIAARPGYEIFVNSAGTNRPKPLSDVSLDDYDAVLGLNLRAAVFAAQAVTKQMIAEGRHGSVINMSSQMGHVGAANRTLYSGNKNVAI